MEDPPDCQQHVHKLEAILTLTVCQLDANSTAGNHTELSQARYEAFYTVLPEQTFLMEH